MAARARRPLALTLLSVMVRAPLAALAWFELRCRDLLWLALRPRYRVEGTCQHNGVCCHHILVVEQRWLASPPLSWLVRFWLQGIHRFRPTANQVEMPDGGVAHIYSCDNLDENRRCREHLLRPMICRIYPRPGHFVPPVLHRGCGYRVVDRISGEELRTATPLASGEVAKRYDKGALIDRWCSPGDPERRGSSRP
ncbi:MAG: hypothetical protein ABIJ09_10380 [Pseudomonadota bacterium]